MRAILAAALLCGACATPTEPEPVTVPEPVLPMAVPADPADVGSIDAILTACYDVISGEAGEPRDWDRFRSLFHPRLGRLSPVGKTPAGDWDVRGRTVEDYVRMASGFFATAPFHEVELARRTERYGHIAHVFSTYESRAEPDGEAGERGLNSVQLFWDEERWWVLSILWDADRGQQPIPEDYLPSGS